MPYKTTFVQIIIQLYKQFRLNNTGCGCCNLSSYYDAYSLIILSLVLNCDVNCSDFIEPAGRLVHNTLPLCLCSFAKSRLDSTEMQTTFVPSIITMDENDVVGETQHEDVRQS